MKFQLPATFVFARAWPRPNELAYGWRNGWIDSAALVAIAEQEFSAGLALPPALEGLALLLRDQYYEISELAVELGDSDDAAARPLWLYLALWMRRVELASNIHAGAKRRDLRLQHLLETVAWAVPAAVVCTGIGFVLALSLAPAEAVSLCLRTTQLTGSLLLGALIGAVAGVQFMRERDLSRFVKGT